MLSTPLPPTLVNTIAPATDLSRLNLSAYFERIGYTGGPAATLETLRQIHFLHPQAIPFENLNPFLRLPVQLDLASLQQKLVFEGRGGYCYEQNLYLSHVLTALGFTVKGLSARVLWNVPEGVTNPRTHMLLQVMVDGMPYLADVGFGGLTMTSPLQLIPDLEQPTSHETLRLRRSGDEFLLEALVREEWKPLYQFGLDGHLQPDYEVASWYLSNNPTSRFVNDVLAARTTPACRYTLRTNELAIHYPDRETERTVLTQATDLMNALENRFLIKLPQPDNLKIKLENLLMGISQVSA